jgi:hypothetical protein
VAAHALPELREELHLLLAVMLQKNRQYMEREAELAYRYRHEPLKLAARRDDDYVLKHASGAAKTCAVLVSALAATITAELACAQVEPALRPKQNSTPQPSG